MYYIKLYLIRYLKFLKSFIKYFFSIFLSRTLPKTLEEGEHFGKGESMFDFPCLSKKNKNSSDSDSEMEPYTKRKQSLTAGLERGVVVASVNNHHNHADIVVDDNSNSRT